MIFTLEALEARHGDCLILHYGRTENPKFIVIDGGPRGVYSKRLKERLAALKARHHPNHPMPVEMLMISHIDNDHINGALDWLRDLAKLRDKGEEELPYDINTLWHNSFDDIIGNDPEGLMAALAAAVSGSEGGSGLPASVQPASAAGLMLASVAEGRELRQLAEKLDLLVNTGFQNLVIAPSEGKKVLDWGDGLKLTVVSPQLEEMKSLQTRWDNEIVRLKKEGKLKPASALELAAEYSNITVENLASIVVLAEFEGKRILLTGDSRGDMIVKGLEAAGLLDNGKIHVDLLKVPHHGSNKNFVPEFFEQVSADQYVISADGNFGNPDPPTLQWLSDARKSDKFRLWMTNRSGKQELGPHLIQFAKREKTGKRPHTLAFRQEDEPSLKVDLLDEVEY